ncbi:MAG: hypothetical protein AAF391_12220, partial [Bacteroidota bacterium]
ITAITDALVARARKEDQVHVFLGDMNIEQPDDDIMQALQDSGMTVPEYGPTNMAGTKWFDQMAFTERGKATRKTRLLRHGKFDWRHAVFGPHPNEEAPPLTQEDIDNGISRLTLEENLNHYEQIVQRIRIDHDKEPYVNWPNAYRKWTTFEMSDHLPIWMELEIDYSDDYLRAFTNP